MGFFDVTHTQKCNSQKEVIALQHTLKSTLKEEGFESSTQEDKEIIENYQASKALLKYNLSFHQEKNDLIIQGELQQTLLLAILIIFGILFTYGIAVILVVGYTYYQKVHTTKAIKQLIESIQGTQLA